MRGALPELSGVWPTWTVCKDGTQRRRAGTGAGQRAEGSRMRRRARVHLGIGAVALAWALGGLGVPAAAAVQIDSEPIGSAEHLATLLLPTDENNLVYVGTVANIALSQYENRPGHSEPYTEVTFHIARSLSDASKALADSTKGVITAMQFNAIFQDSEGSWEYIDAGNNFWCMPGDSVLLVVTATNKHGDIMTFPERVIRYVRLIDSNKGTLLRLSGGWAEGAQVAGGSQSYEEIVRQCVRRPLKAERFTLAGMEGAIAARLEALSVAK